MVSDLGVTKYAYTDDNFENGSLSDNINGTFSFLSPAWNYKIPFDKGYYIEFKTKDFSEFWLNNGAENRQTPLRSELVSFRVNKTDNVNVMAEWKTAYEINIHHFEIELARGENAFQNGQFIKIGEVMSPGASSVERSYSFPDVEAGKIDIRYYRLKIVYNDNTFMYAPVMSVMFDDDIQWQVFPNPSNGNYEFLYKAEQNKALDIRIFDASGRQVKQMNHLGNGLQQKIPIDLRSAKFPPGVYLFVAESGDTKYSIRLVKK
jgi:hypothetical protein